MALEYDHDQGQVVFPSKPRVSSFDDVTHPFRGVEEREYTPILFRSELDPIHPAMRGSDVFGEMKSLKLVVVAITNNANMRRVFQMSLRC
jgi:hypothetical protein